MRARGHFPKATDVDISVTPTAGDALTYVSGAPVEHGAFKWHLPALLGATGPNNGWWDDISILEHDDALCRGRSHRMPSRVRTKRTGTARESAEDGFLDVQW